MSQRNQLYTAASTRDKYRAMKLKIPPGITALVSALSMWIIYNYLSWSSLHFSLPMWLPTVVGLIGMLFGLVSLSQFYWHQTSVDPHQPNKAGTLVRRGPYRLSRNPMYFGLLLGLTALALYLGSILSFLMLPVFVWYMNTFQIGPEEEILEQKFGAGYRLYKKEVRRWI